MKADLHLHTLTSKNNGDSIKWISLYDSLKKIMNNGVKLASFTDHNDFDIELYLEARKLAKTANITIFPGVEINVVRKNGIIGHMLIIFREDMNEQQLKSLSNEIKKIYKNGISINEINNWFSSFESIRIIHIGKSDYFEIDDLDGLNYDAFEITNASHPNYIKVTKANYISSIVAFSDTHMWDDYPQNNKLFTYFDGLKEASFNELKNLLKENKNFTKTN